MTPITDEMNMASVESEPEASELVESADVTALEFSVAEAVSEGPVESAGAGAPAETGSTASPSAEAAPAISSAPEQAIAEREAHAGAEEDRRDVGHGADSGDHGTPLTDGTRGA